MKIFVEKFGFYICLLFCITVYLSLAFKNPFATNSLISNLEPYPDTLFYSVPAWNFVHGKGFIMAVFGTEITNIVPPAYSIYLIPFFALFRDVRSFYWGNLLLGMASIIVFGLIVDKIFKRNLLINLLLPFFLVTNFYFYNLPGLLMAENITVFFTLCAFWVLISGNGIRTTILAGLVGMTLLLIKLSNLPLGLSFMFLYTIRIIAENKKIVNVIKHTLILVLFLALSLVNLNVFSMLNKQINPDTAVGFSDEYFIQNLSYYLNSLLGGKTVYLWYQEIFLDKFITIFALLGLGIGLWNKNTRRYTSYLGLMIVSLLLFMSFFYYPDSRYILAVLPLILFSVGFFFHWLSTKFNRSYSLFLVCFVLGIYFFGNQYLDKKEIRLISFKKQVGLNFLHKEDPWNYLAIQNFNNYFRTKKENIYLGTFLPPFYMNYFMNGNYKYLPISPNQEFSHGLKDYIGKIYSNNLILEYNKLLNSDNDLYVSNYYLNNNPSLWNQDFNNLINNFNLEKVADGCYGSCNIYRLNPKDN